MRRRAGPGLLRVAARTAVVAGTATAVSGRVQTRQMSKQQAKYDEQQQQEAAQAPLPPPPAGGDDVVDKLKELASLHEAGALSDEEFAAAKAQALNG